MNPLEIVVTGNVSDVKTKLADVRNEVSQTAIKADQFTKTMERLGPRSGQSIALLTGRIEALKAEMANIKDIPVLINFNKEIAASQIELDRLSNAGKKGFNELGQAVKSTGNPLSHGYNQLRKLAYILPGIGISGIVAFATGPIIDFVEKLIEASSATKLIEQNLANLNDVMQEADKQAGKEITDLKILYKAATDVNIPINERLKAVKALQKEFPDYFGNIKTETILNGDAKKSYDNLTVSILQTAKATAAKAKLDALEAQRLDIAFQKQKVINATNQEIAKAQATTGSGGQIVGGLAVTTSSQGLTKTQAQQIIKNRRDLRLATLDQNDKDIQAQEDFLTKFATLPSLAEVIEKKDKIRTKKGKDQYTLDLSALEDYYKKVQAHRVKDFDANLTDSKKNTTAINAILLQDEMDFLEKKLQLIKKYGKKEGDTELLIAKTNQKALANQRLFTQDQNNTLSKIPGAPALNLKSTTQKIDPKPIFEYSDAIKKNIALQQRQLELMYETSAALDKTVGPAFTVLFETILSGSGNAFRAFGEALKQMIVQLGAAILKAALFAAILSAINPFATGIPGASGFGAIFKSLLKFSEGGKVPGFAGGGAINGPGTSTSDSILARLSKGEYVMNAAAVSKFGSSFFDSLNSGVFPKFSGGGLAGGSLVASNSHVFIPSVSIKGSDLLIAFNRASARASRNG